MEKIKVSKSVADALDKALKVMSKEKFFEEHSNKMQWNLDIYLPLNEISNWDMAQILINGYEVEKTPENELLQYYEEWKVIHKSAIKGSYDDGYIKGVLRSTESTLNILNIKIKGIND